MESSQFLSGNNKLVSALFGQDNAQPLQQNRLFCLQQGESINLRSNPEQSFLYLLKGEIQVAHGGSQKILDDRTRPDQRVVALAINDDYTCITAQRDAVFNHVDSRRLDDLVTWSGIASMLQDEPEKLAVLSKVMTTRSLTNLPVESVYSLISRMRLRAVSAGEVIIEQGAQAEHFYILHKGSAEVWSMGLYDDSPQKVNVLREGDSFGEDALVTGGTRNATIKMRSDGVILEGDKKDFLELIAKPVIEEVDTDLVQVLKNKPGYQLLDVRYEEEHEDCHIEGCCLLPLHELRNRLDELDPDTRYITYCRSGKRSAVAALIMKQRKLNAVSMKGGMNRWLETETQAGAADG